MAATRGESIIAAQLHQESRIGWRVNIKAPDRIAFCFTRATSVSV